MIRTPHPHPTLSHVFRFLLRTLFRTLFRVQVHGLEHLQQAGPGSYPLVVANHVSSLDALLLYAFIPGIESFAPAPGNRCIAWLLRPFVECHGTDLYDSRSLRPLARGLSQGRRAAIFPEGRPTATGTLMRLQESAALLAERCETNVLAAAIDNLPNSPLAVLCGRRRGARLTLLPAHRTESAPRLRGRERRQATLLWLERCLRETQLLGADYRRTLPLVLFEAARRYGMSRTVCEDESGNSSYRRLFIASLALARALRRQPGLGERVGIMLANHRILPPLLVALQTLGRVPAMLNYSTGKHSCRLACETAGIRTIVTSRRFLALAGLEGLAESLPARKIYLEELHISLADRLLGLGRSFYFSRHYRNLCRAANPDATAAILFTSGSEGTPKAVLLSHANILANCLQCANLFDFRRQDLLFNCLPCFHSFGLGPGLLLPLLTGMRVFLYPSPLQYRRIPQLIYDRQATILLGTDTFLHNYARYAHPYDLHTLRYVLAGAERLRDETRQQWLDRFGIRILQGYGTTETSPVAAVNTPLAERPGSVGRLLPGLEHRLSPVTGFADSGRLLLRGPNVMSGYLLPESGEAAPPAAEGEAGWYDTGDIARIDEEGFLWIHGRIRRFAKIGGEMVSLDSVEALAARCWPQARHAAILLADQRRGERILLATEQPHAERAALHRQARKDGYGNLFLPARIVSVEQLPLLGSGKPDYQEIARRLKEDAG